MVNRDFEPVRDPVVAERNRVNWLRWADALARDYKPRDIRSWQQQDMATDLHAKAMYLRRYARRLYAARHGAPKVADISMFRAVKR